MVQRHTLAALKRQPKRLRAVAFTSLRKRHLPRPFDKLGGPRLQHSGLIDVSETLAVLFLVRDGESPERRAFYGYLVQRTLDGLLPLVILHYHPSHKGVHILVNCDTSQDYTSRQLPGAPELTLRTPDSIDPGTQAGRLRLINLFCERCGVRIAPDDEQLI